jgi:putative hemolysin
MFAKTWYEPMSRIAHSFIPGAREICRTFTPKIELRSERGGFIIKTASTPQEIMSVLRLRYEVFYREFQNKKFPVGIDLDSYDRQADHLIIIDTKSEAVVGTYRLISSRFSKTFYSESEFELGEFLSTPTRKLELGRACIHKNYRTGFMISLLWRGVSEYARLADAQILFGCTSVKTMDPVKIAQILAYLDGMSARSHNPKIVPTKNYRVPMLEVARAELEDYQGKELIPPLLESYIKMGGKVLGDPALDRDFKCTDLFTVLDLTAMNSRFERRYVS